MEAIEKLIQLHEKTLIPMLKDFGEDLKTLTKDIQAMRIGQEKHQGRIKFLEEKVGLLKCEENTDIMRGLGSRVAKLEEIAAAGHKQNEECRDKNRKVDEALRLAETNRAKNEEQEARYKAFVRYLFWIFGGILTLIGAAYYTKHMM